MLGIAGAVALCAAGAYAAFQLSPWPSVLLIRHAFDQGAAQAEASIAPHVPTGVSAQRNIQYAVGDRDAMMDVFAPADAKGPLPAVVWVHGGGFIAGSRSGLAGYLQVLAARGFVTVATDYTTAPEAQFPTPVRQTSAALAYVIANAGRFNIDPNRIFLAGDSAGAQIVAQLALTITDAAYGKRIGIEPSLARKSLRGLVLFCGPYDPTAMNFDGPFATFMRTVIWSYVGTPDPQDARVAQMAVTPHVTDLYPPVFISVGNADPLARQSVALADALQARGVQVDALFFPPDQTPPLGHEYQLMLSTDAGRIALERAAAFLHAHAE